jgi:hypothetical protein
MRERIRMSKRAETGGQKRKSDITRMPLTKARIGLGGIIRSIANEKKMYILEKDGIPVAGLIGIDELEDYLELIDTDMQEQIREGYSDYKKGRTKSAAEVLKSIKEKS